MFSLPTVQKVEIAKSYRTYLARLMSPNGKYTNLSFFAEILSGLTVKENPNISTFCIGIHSGHWLMQYSPTMVEELDEYGAGVVIAHEVGHAILGHTFRIINLLKDLDTAGDPLAVRKAKAIIHIAADYALNSWLIDDCEVFSLRDLKCRLGSPTDMPWGTEGDLRSKYAGIHPSDVELPSSKSMEWYIAELANRIVENDPKRIIGGKKQDGNSAGTGTGDSAGSGEDQDNKEGYGGKSKGTSSGSGKDEPGEGGCSGGGQPGEEQATGGGSARESTMDKIKAMSQELLEALEGSVDTSGGMFDDQARKELLDNYPTVQVLESTGMSLGDLEDKLNRAMEAAAQGAMESCKSRGTMPGNMRSQLQQLWDKPQISWQEALRRYAQSKRSPRKQSTVRKIRRRYAELSGLGTPSEFPGKKTLPDYNIVFAIDTSGSVSDTEVAEILTELKGLRAMSPGTTITVVECDTRIHRIYELKKELGTEVYGRGGTDFDPVFELLSNKTPEVYAAMGVSPIKDVDLLIYSTDGECPLPPPDIRIPANKVLWLLSSRGCLPGQYGERPTTVSGPCQYGNYIKIMAVK